MTELVVIFVIGLLVLGPKRLPEMARSLGKSLAEFRRASTDLRREFMAVGDETPEPPARTPSAAPGPDAESEKPARDRGSEPTGSNSELPGG